MEAQAGAWAEKKGESGLPVGGGRGASLTPNLTLGS